MTCYSHPNFIRITMTTKSPVSSHFLIHVAQLKFHFFLCHLKPSLLLHPVNLALQRRIAVLQAVRFTFQASMFRVYKQYIIQQQSKAYSLINSM
jgi:hypothetical protein